MIDVKFKSRSAGACSWCGKEKDIVYDVAFSDQSFVGRLCKSDLLRAIGMKVDASDSERKAAAVPSPNAASPSK